MINSIGSGVKFIVKLISGIGTVFLGCLVLLMLFFVWIATSVDKSPKVPDGAALVLAPSGFIVEKTRVPDPIEAILEEYDYASVEQETNLHDLLEALRRATFDDRIPGVVLFTDGMRGAGPATTHTLAKAVRSFKEQSGKPVYAVSTAYDQSDYLIAAQADKIFVNNYGSVLLTGYGAYPMYLKGMLDRIDANVNVFRVGTFKSAVEPYLRTDMSDAAKEANLNWLGVLWDEYTGSVEAARGLSGGSIDRNLSSISSRLRSANGNLSTLAANEDLVDQVAASHEWRSQLINEFGASGDGSTFYQIDHSSYLRASQDLAASSSNHIAVIVARGEIVMGQGDETVTAAETMVQQIRDARLDRRVKAIVIRVDSPGGSAFASELIRQELVAAQGQGIPVVASFGSIAASGGYWISAAADEIWASPTSITGSIGIFGLFVTFEDTLANVGVTTDGVGTTDFAGALSIARPLNDTVKDVVQQNIEEGYRRFLNIVADGRGMTVAEVDKVAQGRVWAGKTAHELGLVDKLGGLDQAVASAASLAGINNDDYKMRFFIRTPDAFDQFLMTTFATVGVDINAAKSSSSLSTSHFGKLAARLKADANRLMMFNDPMGHYALCEECGIQ